MVGFRVDANSIIATGHMMRCITIARQIVKCGGSVTFFMSDEESKTILEENTKDIPDIGKVILHSDHSDLESELPVLIEQLQLRGTDILIIDSYHATYDYIKAIDRVCKTVYIDDLNEKVLPVDMLINYNVYAGRFDYENVYAGVHGHNDTSVRLLIGPMYAPLREQFALESAHKRSDEVKNILLSVGGADTCNMLLPLLKWTMGTGLVDHFVWHVVIGDYVENAEEIEAFISAHPGLVAHRSVKNMAELMSECDVAICAAGTMLTECAAVSLPAVFMKIADNQRYVAEYWSKNAGMIYAGDVQDETAGGKDAVITEIFRQIKTLIASPDRLKNMRDSLGGVTDGRGAERIAEEILKLNAG